MRTVSFLSLKGGAGKTTICLNVAVAAEARGDKVLICDFDPQASAAFWAQTRGTTKPPTVIEAAPEKNSDILKAASELGATLVLIDAPSRLDAIALAAVRAASLIVLPTAPNLVDLAAAKPTLDPIDSAGKLNATVAVLNNVDERGGAKRVDQARGTLVAFNVAVARTAISRLPEFSDAFDRGKGVTELRAGNKAAAQIQTLLIDLEKLARRIGSGVSTPKRNGAAQEVLQ